MTVDEVRRRLRDWSFLERRKATLEARMKRLEERIQELRGKLSDDGIMSSITQRYERMLLGLPASTRVQDKMAERVVSMMDALVDAVDHLDEVMAAYHRCCCDLDDIEDMVACLEPRYQELVTLYYRDKAKWRDICDLMYISKSRLYEMLHEAERMMALEGAMVS
ncbi:MAG: hypothetical protein K6T83_04995 [Alicyclobacillus sp.]|uniref:hypothetical protein n=1 Tax=Alicyclobacillus fructus TaxID=2816082 RepID=UPI001A8D25F5|nr:hypothetical protein [Alicyclobacillus fructus]MCL6442806.1 hypothetical protein [Alicyclobacillus sp.]